MLIISKHKDYYDAVSFTIGIDKTIVYKRETRVISGTVVDEYKKLYNDIYTNNKIIHTKYVYHNGCYAYINLIGFCGKLYPYIEVFRYHYDSQYFFNVEDALSFIRSISDKPIDKYEVNELHNIFNSVNLKEVDDIHFKIKSPVFCYREIHYRNGSNEFIIDPNLEELKFFKIFDTYQAHQMIMQYISGVLGNIEKNTIESSDKVKIIGHGFDYKTSFRKSKSK